VVPCDDLVFVIALGLFQPDIQAPELVRRVDTQRDHVLEAMETRRRCAKRVVAREAGVPGERPDVDRGGYDERHFEGSARRRRARGGSRV